MSRDEFIYITGKRPAAAAATDQGIGAGSGRG